MRVLALFSVYVDGDFGWFSRNKMFGSLDCLGRGKSRVACGVWEYVFAIYA